MIGIENTTALTEEEPKETETITLRKFEYDSMRDKCAKLEAIKNAARLYDVMGADLILAICGVIKEDKSDEQH